MHDPEAGLLGPGTHASAESRFSYSFAGNLVHVEPTSVGDPFAGGLRTWDDPMLRFALRGVADAITPGIRELLPWALTTVSAYSPGSLGLFGPASYSGPRATGLIGNLAHRTRSDAFAAELIVAACLACRPWPSAAGWHLGGLARAAGRIDFGVKLLTEAAGRSTVEADILLTDATGRRHAIDVKHSRGVYRAAPARSVLAIVDQAIRRREIDSFSFVTPTRFRPVVHRAVSGRAAVHLVEGVWPADQDIARIRTRQRQAVDYAALLRSHQDDDGRLMEHTVAAISTAYRLTWGTDRPLVSHLVSHEDAGGYSCLLDAAAPRIVAAWGRGAPPAGIELTPRHPDRTLGHGPLGRRWRELTARVAAQPAAPFLVRPVYDDSTDEPAQWEYLLLGAAACFDRFPNRLDLP